MLSHLEGVGGGGGGGGGVLQELCGPRVIATGLAPILSPALLVRLWDKVVFGITVILYKLKQCCVYVSLDPDSVSEPLFLREQLWVKNLILHCLCLVGTGTGTVQYCSVGTERHLQTVHLLLMKLSLFC